MRTCAFNTGRDTHLLDHIAPLASLLSLPLLLTEEENFELAKLYYPEVASEYCPDLEYRLKEIAERFDALIECKFWLPRHKEIFKSLYHKDMKLLFCPHGQSDKGYQTPLLSPYSLQDGVFVYGELLLEMLQDLTIQIPPHATIGNYRLSYYRKHEKRMGEIAEKSIFSKFRKKNKTLLYAPTWKDADGATSFFHYAKSLSDQIPSDWNVIVKVHPLLSQRDPSLFYRLGKLEDKRENWILIEDFPYVYPILDKVDAYLGDYSSIGYDFLQFEKPMFFFSQNHLPKARLHSCGSIIPPNADVFQTIEHSLSSSEKFRPLQRQLYTKAFDETVDLSRAFYSLVCGGRTKTEVRAPMSPTAGSASSS